MTLPRSCLSIVALILALSIVASAPADIAAANAPSGPAEFLVGAATTSIVPQTPEQATNLGGYGKCKEALGPCPQDRARTPDDLQARAMYVAEADGSAGVLTVSVDVQGWFAGYQHGPRLGITELREELAGDLTDAGVAIDPGDIIVSSNHCHACPGIVGIWAATNVEYLRLVYEQTLQAGRDAVAAARPATMVWAQAEAGFLNAMTVGQENVNEGWEIDGVLPILQATDLDGDVVMTYATVPTHENILAGPTLGVMSSGYFGVASRWLTAEYGGVGIVGPATLGDQTSPMQFDSTRLVDDPRPSPDLGEGYPQSFDTVDRLGSLVGSLIAEALSRDPHPIYDGTVDAATQYALVPLTNPVVGAQNIMGPLFGYDEYVGIARAIDRSFLPPYAVGPTVGVWFTTLRIGSVAIVSEPGEAFPHITSAIRRSLVGAELVTVIGNAQDQLGYYYEPWALPQSLYYSVDHYLFNVSQALASAQIDATAVNGALVGFDVLPAVADPTVNDHMRVTRSGIQFLVFPEPRGHDIVSTPGAGTGGITLPVGVYVRQARTRNYGIPGERSTKGAPILIDFGDGSDPQVFQPESAKEENNYRAYQHHTFPEPGDYLVRAVLPGTDGYWEMVVHITDRHHVTATPHYQQGDIPEDLQRWADEIEEAV